MCYLVPQDLQRQERTLCMSRNSGISWGERNIEEINAFLTSSRGQSPLTSPYLTLQGTWEASLFDLGIALQTQ